MLSFRVFFLPLWLHATLGTLFCGGWKKHHQGDIETTGGQLFFVRLQRGQGLFGKDEG